MREEFVREVFDGRTTLKMAFYLAELSGNGGG